MKKNKKGVVEIQFNWIFILIAGAVILLFFGYLITTLRGTAEEKASTTVLSNLKTILSGAGVTTGTLNLIKLPKSDVEISCERFSIGSLRKTIEADVIFAPRRIKGRDLLTYTLEWAIPYRVTNFLYLTSPQVRYIFVDDASDSGFEKLFSETIPDEINKGESIITPDALSTIEDLNNYEVRFIFFNIDPTTRPPTAFEDMDDKDVTALRIYATEGVGDLTFYQKKDNDWVLTGASTFLRKPTLLGAIFSDDHEDYICNMRKAIKRLNLVTQVYQSRSEFLETHYEPTTCDGFHNVHNLELDRIEGYSSSYNEGSFQDIHNDATEVARINNLAELSSCVLIY